MMHSRTVYQRNAATMNSAPPGPCALADTEKSRNNRSAILAALSERTPPPFDRLAIPRRQRQTRQITHGTYAVFRMLIADSRREGARQGTAVAKNAHVSIRHDLEDV